MRRRVRQGLLWVFAVYLCLTVVSFGFHWTAVWGDDMSDGRLVLTTGSPVHADTHRRIIGADEARRTCALDDADFLVFCWEAVTASWFWFAIYNSWLFTVRILPAFGLSAGILILLTFWSPGPAHRRHR